MKLRHLTPLGALLLLGASPTPTPAPTNLGMASSFVAGAPYVAPTAIAAPTPTYPFFATIGCFNITQNKSCQYDPNDPNILLVAVGDQLEFYLTLLDPTSSLPASMTFAITGASPRTLTETPPVPVIVTADTADKWTFVSSTANYTTNTLTVRAQ